MAAYKGYYRKRDLEVNITEPKDHGDAVDAVMSGDAEFGVASSSIAMHRLRGRSVVALAAIFQSSPLALIVQEREDLKTPADLVGKKIMIETDADELHIYLREHNVSLNQIVRMPHEQATEAFLSKKIDGMTAYLSDEIFPLRKAGVKYRLFPPPTGSGGNDDFYSDVLFTSQDIVENKPAVVRAFVAASLEGWEYALSHVDETIKVINDRYQSARSEENLRFEAEEMKKLMFRGNAKIGVMNRDRWLAIAKRYIAAGLAPASTEANDIPQLRGFIYGDGYRSKGRAFLTISIGVLLMLALAAFVIVCEWLASVIRHQAKPPEPLPADPVEQPPSTIDSRIQKPQ